MALPLPNTTQVFSSDQKLAPRAYYFDTSSTALRLGPAFAESDRYTAFGSGVEFALFDLLDGGFAPTSRGDIEAALTAGSTQTTSVLGYDLADNYRTGVVPVVYMYWGAGSPPGGSRAKQTLLKFSGYVTSDIAQATLILAGQGTVHVTVTRKSNGAIEEIIPISHIHEPDSAVSFVGVTSDTIRTDWGYAYNDTPIALNKGDKVEIYYWHNGEEWGGIAAKIIPTTVTPATFLTQIREAAVVGTSLIAKEQLPIAGRLIKNITDLDMQMDEEAVALLHIAVALTRWNEAEGWHIESDDDNYVLVDNADVTNVLQKARMVHFEGLLTGPDETTETYERFTGYIDDIVPSQDSETATLMVRGIKGRLSEPFDENNPDRLDYHAHGYILREPASEPVFGIPAFDAWPLEYSLTVLMLKAGIDSFNFGLPVWSTAPQYGKWRFKDATSQQDFFGARTFGARFLGDPTKVIPLERNPNYGNVLPLKKDYLPDDDKYLFAPDVTLRLYDRAKALTDHFGYLFYFNALGQCVLTGRNNPVYFQQATQSGTYLTTTNGQDQTVNVSAVGGISFKKQDSAGAWTRVLEGHFSRLDLYVGIGRDATTGFNGGLVNVLIEVNDGAGNWTTVSTSQVSTYADLDEAYYYDDPVRPDGTNAAILSILRLPFDHYRVTLSQGGPDPQSGQLDCLYRINGAAVFERDPERSFYNSTTRAEVTVSTLSNLLTVTPDSAAKDMRNQVIVVGARKATITDSAKLATEQNPNNPEQEFYVSVAVDPFSIYDPTSSNFLGMKRMTVIFDEKVTDSDYARWLARYILYRQRTPKVPAKLSHTLLPMLDIRDALFVVEERNLIVQHRLWVRSFTERWKVEDDGTVTANTEIDGDSYPEIPSYQPREDVDIDTLFIDPTDNVGEPAIDVTVSYKNLYARSVTNVDLADATRIKSFVTKAQGSAQPMASDAITNGSVFTLSHPVIPETMYLGWNVSSTNNIPVGNFQRNFLLVDARVLVNTPYRHFYYISGWNASKQPTLTFTFEEGDGTAGVYDKAYYSFPNLSGQWYALYDYLLDRTKADSTPAENPFYDPYSSERGNLVEIDFTLLVSGRVRVSVWDANRTGGQETLVAWLTAPSAKGDEPEAHWSYMESGKKSFVWDGVDNVGQWNIQNTQEMADQIKGAFGDKPLVVGATYFAANDRTTNRHTLIGDAASYNFDADNSPFYTIGQFGQFYVKIEVLNDALLRKDLAATGQPTPRIVKTTALPNAGTWNTTSEVYVWTHLGEPTQCAIRIQDWVGAGTWVPGTVTQDTDWSAYSTPDTDATIRDGKPVRITFVPRARRGPLFKDGAGQPDANSNGYKLTRQVHHKGTIFDQFWTLFGHTWQDFNSRYQVGGTEAKRVTSRMFHNEDHTLEFEDTSWRTGEQLAQFEWIFDPSLFKKDFGTGIVERLRYADYEQLEQLPGFDAKQTGGTAKGERAYLILAFLSHLFYFSVMTLDRSGRRQWCLNSWVDDAGKQRGFIDRSKIVSSNWLGASENPASGSYRPYTIVDYERAGAERYLARSIFVRQWKEPGWKDGSYAGNPVTKYGIDTDPSAAHQLLYTQLYMKDFAFERNYLNGGGPIAGYDKWMEQYTTSGAGVNGWTAHMSPNNSIGGGKPTFPLASMGGNFYWKPLRFGSWGFDRTSVEGFFTPNPSRDFHPFWRYPYMPDWAAEATFMYTTANDIFTPPFYNNHLDILSCSSSQINYRLRDPAAKDIWYGFAYSETFAQNYFDIQVGQTTNERNKFFGARLEKTVEEIGAEDPTTNYHYTIDQTEIPAFFDYVRQDSLDRFDQYRGVISRAAYADRKSPSEGDNYLDTAKRRAASAQPLKASGTYLLNLGRYDVYTLAPIHALIPQLYIHFMDHVTDWFDMRFQHEYVWTSSRYYPVSRNGGAAYSYMRDEYTKASEWAPAPWWSGAFGFGIGLQPSTRPLLFTPGSLLFDEGAWAGWKGDIDSGSWAADAHLRWREHGTISIDSLGQNKVIHAHGGFGGSFAATGLATAFETWLDAVAPDPKSLSERMNIHDMYFSKMLYPRLAVGPEVPESRSLIMNLSLPERLKG